MNGAIACHQCSSSGNVPKAKIIARKVAGKGNRQQRGCSLSRKWSHTRSRCKIDAVYFPNGTAPKCGAEVEDKSAAMCRSSIERSAPTSETSKRRARKSRVAAFLPRCIFNLAMKEWLHGLSKYDCQVRYAMQPINGVGEKTYQARMRRTTLSIYRQQPRIHYNRRWKSVSSLRTEVAKSATINHAGRKRANKDRL